MEARGHAPPRHVDLGEVPPPPGVYGQDHRLGAEVIGKLPDELGPPHRGGVHAHLVGPRKEELPRVLQGAHPPAHGEGDEDPFRHPRHHVQEDGPFLVGGGDVQEDELVGPRLVVGPGRLHGVPGVP